MPVNLLPRLLGGEGPARAERLRSGPTLRHRMAEISKVEISKGHWPAEDHRRHRLTCRLPGAASVGMLGWYEQRALVA